MTDQELIERVRLLLGSPDQSVIPDEVIATFLSIQKLQWNVVEIPTNEPYVIYNTLVSCIQWLLAREVTSGTSSATRRREKIGNEEIEVEMSSGTNSWQDFLDYILANPDYVDSSISSSKGLVVIGGVRNDEYHRVRSDINSRDNYTVNSVLRRKRRYFNPYYPYK